MGSLGSLGSWGMDYLVGGRNTQRKAHRERGRVVTDWKGAIIELIALRSTQEKRNMGF